MSGDFDRVLPLASEALAVSRELAAPGPIAWNLMVLAVVYAHQDPDQAQALIRESLHIGAMVGEMNIMLSALTVFAPSYMGDWNRS